MQATIVKQTGVVSFSSHIYCNCTHSQKSWCTFIVLHYHIIFSDVVVMRQRNCFTFIGIPANSCSNGTLNATIEKSMVGSLVCENNNTPFMVLHQLTPKKLIFEGLSQEVNLKKKKREQTSKCVAWDLEDVKHEESAEIRFYRHEDFIFHSRVILWSHHRVKCLCVLQVLCLCLASSFVCCWNLRDYLLCTLTDECFALIITL